MSRAPVLPEKIPREWAHREGGNERVLSICGCAFHWLFLLAFDSK